MRSYCCGNWSFGFVLSKHETVLQIYTVQYAHRTVRNGSVEKSNVFKEINANAIVHFQCMFRIAAA